MKHLAPIVLLLPFLAGPLLGGVAAGDEPGLAGHYSLRGQVRKGARYRGEARILKRGAGLELVVRRGEVSTRGLLRPEGKGYVFSSEATRGIVSSLPFAADSSKKSFEADFEVRGGMLLGRWRIRQEGKVIASGRELLRRSKRAGGVHLAISVDWEGRELSERNLAAIERFRERFPEVALTHFLNAAYFTKSGAAADDQIAAKIRRAIRPQDELGLHLHGWRSLIEAAGVPFKASPSFWGAGHPLSPVGGDLGHEVEIAAYSSEQLQKILTFSRETLAKRGGLEVKTSFRAGGWIAPAHVLEAIKASGFDVDTSAVPPAWHDELGELALRSRLYQLWGEIRPTTQPYAVKTPKGVVIEMPDTGALSDYVTSEEMVRHVREALARQREERQEAIYVHLGFHLETADRYLPRLTEALDALRADANPRLVIETLTVSAARVREGLAAADAAKTAKIAARPSKREGLPLPTLGAE